MTTNRNRRSRVTRRTADATVMRQQVVNDGQEELESTQVDKHPITDLPEHVAHVNVSGGATIAKGDYQSVKINVAVTLPCVPTEDGITTAYQQADALVRQFVLDQKANAERQFAEMTGANNSKDDLSSDFSDDLDSDFELDD